MMVVISSPKAATASMGRSTNDRALRDRPRRGGLLAFAALMIVGSAVAAAVLVDRAGQTQEVLAARVSVAEGHTITRDDLVTKRVAGIADSFAVSEANSLVGTTAVVGVVPGQIITEQMVTESPTPAAGESLVGLNLDPSRAPSAGLEAGDHVTVVAVTSGENGANADELEAPPVLATDARVFEATGSAVEGGGVLITLVVAEADAVRISAYSTAGRVAIVETAAPAEGGGA